MALQNSLIKIEIANLDTKGIYYNDKQKIFADKKQLSKIDLKKLDYGVISIAIKFYFRNKQIKKTLNYHNITGLQAVKKASVARSELREELEKNGVLVKKTFNSFDDLFSDYLEVKSKSLSKNNLYNTNKTYLKWIKPAIGKLEIKKITAIDIQIIINKMLKIGKAPRTAQSIKQITRAVFNYAIDQDIVAINPAVKVDIPSFDNSVNFELSKEKRIELYGKIKEYEPLKYRGIMLFLYFGRRLNEVLTLKWANINFDTKTYIIEDIYSKIRRRQEYPLLEPLEIFLRTYENSMPHANYIFEGEKTQHVTKNTFRHHWKNVIKNAGIDNMRIHDTRHLLGNTLVNQGESLENIGKVLGHSSIAVTKRYSKTSLETADRLLNNYLESK